MKQRIVLMGAGAVVVVLALILVLQQKPPQKIFKNNVEQVLTTAFTLPLAGVEDYPGGDVYNPPVKQWLRERLLDRFKGEGALDAFYSRMVITNKAWPVLLELSEQGPITVSGVVLEPTVQNSAKFRMTVRYQLDGVPGEGVLAGRAQHDGTGALIFMEMDAYSVDDLIAGLGEEFAVYRSALRPR